VRLKQARTVVALFALVLALALTGCSERTVKVQSGERVVCTYGETVSSTVKTIEVPASKAAIYKVTTKTVVCARHKALEELYAAAQKAIADGDLTAARAKLAGVLAVEADYRKAAEQAAAIDAGKKPVPDTSTGAPGGTPGGTTGGGTGVPEGPVASLAIWVPDTISGYKADPVIADATALTRDYVPTGTSGFVSFVVVAEQFGDAAAAKAAAERTIAKQYPASRSTATADGRTLLFGATGPRFAAVAWSEDAILIVIEGYAKSGNAPTLKSELQSIAAAIIP
jgi:hypothetical protein